MSRKSEEEIQAIMEEYRDAPMVNPDKVYPPSAARPKRHSPCPCSRADELYRENRRHGIHRRRPFPKGRAGFAFQAYGYFYAWHAGI